MLTLTPILLLPLLLMILLLTLTLQHTHVLMALLILEALVLAFVLMFPFFSSVASVFFSIILLTFGACEAGLGLSLLVLMTRYYGSDMVKSLSINKC